MLMWSRARDIASNIARWVRGPSTRSLASLPPTNGFAGVARCAAGVASGGGTTQPWAASNAVKTAIPAKRKPGRSRSSGPGLKFCGAQAERIAPGPSFRSPLQAYVVLDRTHALDLLRRRHGARGLVLRVDKPGQLHYATVGLDVDGRGGLRPGVGGDGALHLGRERRVIGELAGAALVRAVVG